MKEVWSTKWKKVLIWLCGYLNIVAFAVVGGYTIAKGDDRLKKTTKTAFIVTLIFAAINAFLLLFNSIGKLTDNYYTSNAFDAYEIMTTITVVAQIIVYTVFILISFFDSNEKV